MFLLSVKAIEATCNTSKLDGYNATGFAENITICRSMMSDATANSKKCQELTLSTSDQCTCWANQTVLINKIKNWDCLAKSTQKAVTHQKNRCIKVFSNCKKKEDASIAHVLYCMNDHSMRFINQSSETLGSSRVLIIKLIKIFLSFQPWPPWQIWLKADFNKYSINVFLCSDFLYDSSLIEKNILVNYMGTINFRVVILLIDLWNICAAGLRSEIHVMSISVPAWRSPWPGSVSSFLLLWSQLSLSQVVQSVRQLDLFILNY